MSDLISRQDAIMHFVKASKNYECGMFDLAEVTHELWEIASAQPEIIRCKDCRWCEDADGLICKNTASWVVATDYDFGCVCAERRQVE